MDQSDVQPHVEGHLAPTPTHRELVALATEPDPSAPGFTRAGRALQKHGYRTGGSAFPRVTGPPDHYNATAAEIVAEILGDERSVVDRGSKQRHKVSVAFIRVIAPDGRTIGYRWDRDETRFRFEGFREPAGSRS